MKQGHGETHQEERLHLILVPHWHLVDIHDGGVPATRNTAMCLDRAEDSPAVFTITLIARETERDEQRLDRLRPIVRVVSLSATEARVKTQTGACIVRHMLL